MKYIKPELEIIRINAEDIMAASAEAAPLSTVIINGEVTTATQAGTVTAASIFDN